MRWVSWIVLVGATLFAIVVVVTCLVARIGLLRNFEEFEVELSGLTRFALGWTLPAILMPTIVCAAAMGGLARKPTTRLTIALALLAASAICLGLFLVGPLLTWMKLLSELR